MAQPEDSSAFNAVGLREGMRESQALVPAFWLARRDYGAVRSDDPSAAHHVDVRHGGDPSMLDELPGEFVDASASINPLGPPAWLRQELERSIGALNLYPDPQCLALRRAIAAQHSTDLHRVIVGNGSSELLAWLPFVAGARRWIVPIPSYGEYRRSAAVAGTELVTVASGPAPDFLIDWAALEASLSDSRDVPTSVILGHPNNPTGSLLDVARFERLRKSHPQVLFVVDEAFADFCPNFPATWQCEAQNLVVLRSLTKSLAIAGLRLGYALASREFSERFRAHLPPWTANHLAQRVGVRAFAEPSSSVALWEQLAPLKAALVGGLERLPRCRVVAGAANWVLLELGAGTPTAKQVAAACRSRKVALRVCDDFDGLGGNWLRISVRRAEENQRIISALGQALGRAVTATAKRSTRSIMLQGCSSDAGKSLLVTALCRCLAEDGYRVAPFKAQNMSNNSGVAADGGELGRAQIVQARACGLEADTRMNPVLLKPTSDCGSQVVVRGQVLGPRDVHGYIATKQHCLDAALEAYDSLAQDFDVIVCEGAGSAGEMNLRHKDIVNMGFVERREMPVLLVGDIDRGGVYASFIGHLAVMSESDRARVRGFIVNRFRGDATLLEDAHRWVERHTGRPILGVMPYLLDSRLPQEDRLSVDAGRRRFGSADAPIRIAVVIPPHVSNTTDIDPLIDEPDVQLHLVERPSELGYPDVIVLLGTKSTVSDLLRLRESGLERVVIESQRSGVEIVGICGGLQMLGERILDPTGVESALREVAGLALLPIETHYAGDKLVRPVRARHLPSGTGIVGYEIHHGTTDFGQLDATFVDDQARVLGGCARDQRVWGTYVHGVFDSDAFRAWFLDRVRMRKGLLPLGTKRRHFGHDAAFTQLAKAFRAHVDYAAILRTMGLS